MPATMYYDQDADLGLLKGKTVAIIGYGSQGHAQAQNLRDSGCEVVVGQRPGGPNHDLAVKDGFTPVSAAEAAKQGDLINILLPDEVAADVYTRTSCPTSNRATCSSSRTASTSTSVRSSRPRGSTRPWSPPKGPATWSGASTPRGAASPA